MLRSIPGPVIPVVVIGPYRSGKSFLLNQLLGVGCSKCNNLCTFAYVNDISSDETHTLCAMLGICSSMHDTQKFQQLEILWLGNMLSFCSVQALLTLPSSALAATSCYQKHTCTPLYAVLGVCNTSSCDTKISCSVYQNELS